MIEETQKLKEFCFKVGADLVGIADFSLYLKSVALPPEEFKVFPVAISIAVKLDDDIINDIEGSPTISYADHYREVNKRLDNIAMTVRGYLLSMGCNATVIEASKITDEKNLCGIVSHKALARLGGLGWQGKSLLIVNPHIGPRFRLATILTDKRLVYDSPLKNRCGSCVLCFKHCPAKAIKNVGTKSYYQSREEAVDLKKCYNKLLEFKATKGIEATVCGVCVKVCPYGRKYKEKIK